MRRLRWLLGLLIIAAIFMASIFLPLPSLLEWQSVFLKRAFFNLLFYSELYLVAFAFFPPKYTFSQYFFECGTVVAICPVSWTGIVIVRCRLESSNEVREPKNGYEC